MPSRKEVHLENVAYDFDTGTVKLVHLYLLPLPIGTKDLYIINNIKNHTTIDNHKQT
jgi:hypothetical protein